MKKPIVILFSLLLTVPMILYAAKKRGNKSKSPNSPKCSGKQNNVDFFKVNRKSNSRFKKKQKAKKKERKKNRVKYRKLDSCNPDMY